MKNGWVFPLLSRLCAAELVREAYRGILGRNPDDAGLKAYSGQLGWLRGKPHGSLAELLTALSRSSEHWRRILGQRADDLVRAAFEGILKRKPGEQELKTHVAQLRSNGDLSGLMSSIAASQEHWELSLARRSEELVGGLYRRIFKRDPDAAGLRSYAGQLNASKDIPGLLTAVAESQDFWEGQITERAEELVRATYRTLLNREPEERALSVYAAQLKEHKNISTLMRTIGESREHWGVVQAANAEELVRAVFAALLNREPDERALQDYAAKLREKNQLTELLTVVAHSQEHWELLLQERASELISAVYRGLLRREPDTVGMTKYMAQFKTTRDLAAVASAIGRSRERDSKLRKEVDWQHPARSYEVTTWVFLHIQKTGGTSLQNMIVQSFGAEDAYHEHDDSLHLHCPAELARYSAFAGHFNHDSLAFIPRRTLNVFTIVRDPIQRLASLYNFWRAHDPSAPGFHDSMRLAQELDLETFYGCRDIGRRGVTWNHMTWCIMGERQWRTWRRLLLSATGTERSRLIQSCRPAIRERIREFSFVGLQEDFAGSCRQLFHIMGRDCPEVRADHSVEKLSSIHAHFRKVAKPALTPQALQVMAALVELDVIVYEEAKALYAKRAAESDIATKRRRSLRPASSRTRAQKSRARG